MKVTDKHILFWGGIFSNFYPCEIRNGMNTFKSSEHYFMYMKAEHFGDHESAKLILEAETPKEAKRLGRAVKGFNEKEWAAIRAIIMNVAVFTKFVQNKALRDELISSKYDGKTFVEASPYDKIWGIGLSEDDPDADDESKWRGLNLLGKVLNKVREQCILFYR